MLSHPLGQKGHTPGASSTGILVNACNLRIVVALDSKSSHIKDGTKAKFPHQHKPSRCFILQKEILYRIIILFIHN